MKKHLTKILPVALALMVGTTGAFAEYTNGANSQKVDYTITVSPYLNIIKDTGLKTSSGVTNYSTEYDQINLDTAMSAGFTVYNNVPGQKIFLRATTGSSTGNAVALGGASDTDLHIVFSNTTRKPTTASIENAHGGTTPAAASNPNCFALTVTPTLDVVEDTAATAAATANMQTDGDGKKVQYTLQNGGYTFKYAFAQTADTDTFSTHDTDGTYTASLYLTSVGTGAL